MKSKTISPWSFLTKWSAAHALVGFIIWYGWYQLSPGLVWSWNLQFGVAALMGLLFAGLQFIVLPKRWLESPMKWLIGSGIGWLIGSFLFTNMVYENGIYNLYLAMSLYVLPAALIQAWFLNFRFKKAWLWIGAVMAGALVDAAFSTTYSFTDMFSQVTAQTIIPGMTAIISGSILLYMSQAFSRESNIVSSDEIEFEDERFERLQLQERFPHIDQYREQSNSQQSNSI